MDNIDEILDFLKKDPSNLSKLLIRFVQDNPNNNVLKLMDTISTITAAHLISSKQKQFELENALKDAVCNKITGTTFDAKSFVIQNWSIAKALFPEGKVEMHCELEKNFFEMFVAALNESQNLIDSDWAKSIVQNNEYLKKVIENARKI